MKSRREALAEVGLAKAGARGKFSNAAKQWLVDQESKGIKFSDSDATTPVARKSAPVKSSGAPSKETETGMTDYVFPSDYRFPESEYRAVVRNGGKVKEYGMREVCNNCRVSLVNHGCNSPVIHGGIIITIEPK